MAVGWIASIGLDSIGLSGFGFGFGAGFGLVLHLGGLDQLGNFEFGFGLAFGFGMEWIGLAWFGLDLEF